VHLRRRCRCPGFAVLSWRRQAESRPLGATARINVIAAPRKPDARRADRCVIRSSSRGGWRPSASRTIGPGRTERSCPTQRRYRSSCCWCRRNCRGCRSHRCSRCPDCSRNQCRADTVAANDGARSDEIGAEHRGAQIETGPNGQRLRQGHGAAQGEAGRHDAANRDRFGPKRGTETLATVGKADCAAASERATAEPTVLWVLGLLRLVAANRVAAPDAEGYERHLQSPRLGSTDVVDG
jgi:hypothetical protein